MKEAVPLVRINIGAQDEIVKLHGSGAELAERVVKFREGHSFFHGPDDFAKIPGLSL